MTPTQSPRPAAKLLLCASVLVASLAALHAAGTRAGTAPPAAPTAPAPAQQTMRPWTALASTGVVDEAALNHYAFDASSFSFRVGSTSNSITERFNVTNTYDNNADPNVPGWTTLELGWTIPATTTGSAALWKVDPCTGEKTLACGMSNFGEGGPMCSICTMSSTQIDFTSNLYYIEVRLGRPTGSALLPRIDTLRLY